MFPTIRRKGVVSNGLWVLRKHSFTVQSNSTKKTRKLSTLIAVIVSINILRCFCLLHWNSPVSQFSIGHRFPSDTERERRERDGLIVNFVLLWLRFKRKSRRKEGWNTKKVTQKKRGRWLGKARRPWRVLKKALYPFYACFATNFTAMFPFFPGKSEILHLYKKIFKGAFLIWVIINNWPQLYLSPLHFT